MDKYPDRKPDNVESIFDQFFEAAGFKSDEEFITAYQHDVLDAFGKAMKSVGDREDYDWYVALDLSVEEDRYIHDKFQTYIQNKVNNHNDL